LIDTRKSNGSEEFMKALEPVIDLKDQKWPWLMHYDVDHMGSIQ